MNLTHSSSSFHSLCTPIRSCESVYMCDVDTSTFFLIPLTYGELALRDWRLQTQQQIGMKGNIP